MAGGGGRMHRVRDCDVGWFAYRNFYLWQSVSARGVGFKLFHAKPYQMFFGESLYKKAL
jgi:hypothetical protein